MNAVTAYSDCNTSTLLLLVCTLIPCMQSDTTFSSYHSQSKCPAGLRCHLHTSAHIPGMYFHLHGLNHLH